MSETNSQRFICNIEDGLNDEQINLQIKNGKTNIQDIHTTKTYEKIIKDNVFTLFNLINAVLAGLVLFVDSYKNLLFLGVILSNIVIGIYQEVRAKRTLDKLSLINATMISVIRNHQPTKIHIEELVLDDIMKLESGNQICADSLILEGMLEVNESLITGESNLVVKKPGDSLYSGSFVVSGQSYVRVEHVGKDNYAYKILSEAKVLKKHKSQLRDSINYILKVVGFIIIPIGISLFIKQFYILNYPLDESIISTVAALLGMIPEGLVLLTSVALAVGSINLAKHKTLVQELYCIETLARVDVLCLDKTGTLTKGEMQLENIIALDQQMNINEILENFCFYLKDDNSTFHAIRNYVGTSSNYHMIDTLSFSSARKISAVSFEEGTFVLGAYEFMNLAEHVTLANQISDYAKQGSRVLTLAFSKKQMQEQTIPDDLCPIALLLLSDPIREEAKETLDYFREQGVDIKIISGDNPLTVQAIACKAGVKNACAIDATSINDTNIEMIMKQYNVFGRVTPQQKKQMVEMLKKQGHIVAMTGDGVNDVPALKESDCSIAMANGSEATKNVANLVLLDSNFASLPYIVYEGRRVINNIQRAASLFLVKTTFSTILAILTLFLPTKYPFMPIQLTLISALTIGIPSFFLALEPNRNRVKGNFITNVLGRALPGAMCVILSIIFLNTVAYFLNIDEAVKSTMIVLMTGASGLCVLYQVSIPFSKQRAIIFISMTALFVLSVVLFRNLFSLTYLSLLNAAITLAGIVCIPLLMSLFSNLSNIFLLKHEKKL
ncbi:MAG: cation-translocating P-type ATPase [Erysipelotrichaceae bacterium]